MQADIVIVGAGTAGLSAAATAAERGASVIALEKAGRPGGNGNLAAGLFAVESRLQRVKQYPLTREQAFKIHMDFTQWCVNARLVKKYIDKSASTIDWLEKLGIEFYDIGSHGIGMNYTWHLIKVPSSKPRANGGYLVMNALAKSASELGAQILKKTRVKEITTDGNRVTGIVASAQGKTIEVKAKAVLLTSGGYGAYWRAPFGVPLHGDGIHMAQELGADVTEGALSCLVIGNTRGPIAYSVDAVLQQPVLMVNLLGERFTNEDAITRSPAGRNALSMQKDGTVFSVLDEDTKNYFIENGLDEVRGYGILKGVEPIYKPVDFDVEMKQVLEQGSETIFMADTIEELAAKMGVNITAFRDTVEEYNRACETGRDDAFCKEARYLRPVRQPKFYACKRVIEPNGSPEGIRINHRTEVLTKEHEVIHGLYAAGMETACNIYRDVYVNYLPGNAFGYGINSGRMAAENACKYIKQIK